METLCLSLKSIRAMVETKEEQEGMPRFLVDSGAKVNAASKHGLTSLPVAVMNDSALLVKDLSDRGADVSRRLEDGRTPLHCAASRASVDILKKLLDLGGRNQLH
ncbi:Ankyrin repeat protein [Colletotrichum higginsianum IMI 349063]|uniref:Ankyrin repeat protein n=1 Tax=Colletotrichum higginsianum (strain IMI 349063) TaxID=759273 RepID=A0A1B7Y116_COLHI|nr:Ankyrin repeat protein [Colletotrichum higginsianum IMI 349063]OBR05708.1 Ankyrin repeat protein [Colletotrichum higginsianum IMI 349063]